MWIDACLFNTWTSHRQKECNSTMWTAVSLSRDENLELMSWSFSIGHAGCSQQVFLLLQKTQNTQLESYPYKWRLLHKVLRFCSQPPQDSSIPSVPQWLPAPLLVPHSCCRFKPLLVNEGRWKRGREREASPACQTVWRKKEATWTAPTSIPFRWRFPSLGDHL